jgi:hypothetical protein
MQVHTTWPCRNGLWLLRLSIAALSLGAAGLAQANTPAPLSDEALEARFWACDVASTHTVLSAVEGAQCVRWQDELKQRRFDGDFERLLAWWRAHKAEQHARRLPPQVNAARR